MILLYVHCSTYSLCVYSQRPVELEEKDEDDTSEPEEGNAQVV